MGENSSIRAAASILFLVLWAGSPATAAVDHPVVFVSQEPVPFTFATIADIFGNFTSYDPAEGQPVGGNLMRLDPDGTVTNLTGGRRIAVRDPEISFDGLRVLFSMKTAPRGRWQVYEIGVDGRGLRRISRQARHNDWDPAYLPDGRILFLSDRLRWSDGYENLPEGQLFLMGSEGDSVRPVATHPHGIFNPLLGSNGLVYFTQWDFHDCRSTIEEDNCDLDVNRFLLWEAALDGSREGHPSFGSHTIYDFTGGYVGVREDPRRPGTFVATLADEFFTWGAGSLVALKPRRNGDRDRPRFLTERVFLVEEENAAGRYRDPYPLADGRILASWAAGPVYDDDDLPTPDFDLVVVERDGRRTPLLSDAGAWLLQPVAVTERRPPDPVPGTALPGYDYGILNARDVTIRHRNCGRVVNGDCQPRLAAGEAASIRFYRLARRPNYYRDFRRYSDPRPELLGEAPIAADGSFAVAVPPFTPLVWELLSPGGRVLVQERFVSEVAPGEVRTCTGCHSPHRPKRVRRPNSALRNVTNLAGVDIDRDDNGRSDLVEALGLLERP